jgi:aminoglycoside 6-adenylyltransferase
MNYRRQVQDFYAKLKQDFIVWAETDPDIRVVTLVGSQARVIKPADEYSDYDIEIFVTEAGIDSDTFIQWMRDYAPYWMILTEYKGDNQSWLILYRGGFKVDLIISPVHELQVFVDAGQLGDSQQRGYDIWLDKDGLVAQLPSPDSYITPSNTPTQEEFQKCIDGFFYGAVYVAKQIRHNNLWKLKMADVYQQEELLKMLEWNAHASNDEPVDTWFRGDFMHDWVDDETWQTLHGVFAHFDADDSWNALFTSIKLFQGLSEETATKLKYEYPKQMISEVITYIEGLQSDSTL